MRKKREKEQWSYMLNMENGGFHLIGGVFEGNDKVQIHPPLAEVKVLGENIKKCYVEK